eukprot:UN33259
MEKSSVWKRKGYRRNQVVTIQNGVIDTLSDDTRETLFSKFTEEIWPKSRNIPISEVEDKLLEIVQDEKYKDSIILNNTKVTEEFLKNIEQLDVDYIIGADGNNSIVRKHYFGDPRKVGKPDFALGVYFVLTDEVKLNQKVNVVLSLMQTRYLLNMSEVSGSGDLYIRVSEEDFNKCVLKNGKPASFGKYQGIIRHGNEPFRNHNFKPQQDNSQLLEDYFNRT